MFDSAAKQRRLVPLLRWSSRVSWRHTAPRGQSMQSGPWRSREGRVRHERDAQLDRRFADGKQGLECVGVVWQWTRLLTDTQCGAHLCAHGDESGEDASNVLASSGSEAK